MREYSSRENWYRRLPIQEKIRLRQNQRHVAHRWRVAARNYGYRLFGGVGALAAAGAANFFVKVPKMSGYKRARRDYGLPQARFDAADGGLNTYVKSRKRSGRNVSKRKKYARTTAAEIEPVMLRYSGVTSYSGIKGYHYLMNHRNTVTGDLTLPIHLYDLTAAINNSGGTVVAARHGTGVRLLSGSQVNFYSIRGSAPDGTDFATDNYHAEVNPAEFTNANGWFGRRAFHCWTDIRLVLYSMLSTPTRFTIELVKFRDESFNPPTDNNNMAYPPAYPLAVVNNNTPSSNDVFNFWADMMKPYVHNPISTVQSNWQKHYRVIKRKEMIIQPRSSINADSTTPNTVELKWFHEHNAVRRYDWQKRTAPAANTELQNDDDFSVWNTTNNLPQLDPKDRVYLVIKAQALPTTGTTNLIDTDIPSISNGTSPTYDIFIRNKYLNSK